MSDQTPAQTFNSIVASLIRTAVPGIAGLILGWLVSINISIPGVSEPALEGVLTFAFGFAYYAAVRLLEKKWPKLGWLLGLPVQPSYPVVPVSVTPTPVIGADIGTPPLPIIPPTVAGE